MHHDDFEMLMEEVWRRADTSLEALEDGQDLDEAIETTHLLALFEGVLDEDMYFVDEGDRRDSAMVALQQMLDACCEPRSVEDESEAAVMRLVDMANVLAACVPQVAWRLRLEKMLHAVSIAAEHQHDLVATRAQAVVRLGSLARVMRAIEDWQPDDDERERLRVMMAGGAWAEAVRQAMEQAVFCAELADA